MKILALEFSSPQRSVAVVRQDEFHEALSGSNEPFTMIDEALRDAKLEREQIECIVVGLGPGSYTGIRSAISIAQGWQLARPIKLLGISSAECIAAQAQADGATGRVNVIVDAQREEFYIAGYELTSGWRSRNRAAQNRHSRRSATALGCRRGIDWTGSIALVSVGQNCFSARGDPWPNGADADRFCSRRKAGADLFA